MYSFSQTLSSFGLGALTLSALLCSSVAEVQAADEGSNDAPPAPTLDQARAAFVEGRELIEQEKWVEAGQRFAFAARAKNTPGLRYYIALCLEKDGQLVAALEQYRLAADLLEVDQVRDVEALVKEAVPRLEKEVPRLVLKGVPEGATLLVDGEERSLQAKEYMLDPGQHVVVVKAAGYQETREVVAVKRSATAILQVRLQLEKSAFEASQQPASNSEAARPVNHGRRAVLWGSVATGTVGVGLGIAGAVIKGKRAADVEYYRAQLDRVGEGENSTCYAPGTFELAYYCDALSGAVVKRDRGNAMMIAGFSLAGIGAVGATLTMLLWPQAGSSESAQGPAPGGAHLGGLELKRLRMGGFIAGRRDWQLGLSGAF